MWESNMFMDMDERIIKDAEYDALVFYKTEYEKIVKAAMWMHDDPVIKANLQLGQSILIDGLPVIRQELARLRTFVPPM